MRVAVMMLAVLMSAAGGGGLDLLLPPGVSFVRCPSRNAAVLDASLVWHDPAGAAFMPPGLSFSAGNGSFFCSTGITQPPDESWGSAGGDFSSDADALVHPSLALVYTLPSLSWFASFSVQPGGLPGEFDEGLPCLELYEFLTVDSIPDIIAREAGIYSDFTSLTCGAARRVLPWLSVALSGRLVVAHRAVTLEAVYTDPWTAGGYYGKLLEVDGYANGLGLAAGIDCCPCSWAGATVRFETPVGLDYRMDVSGNSWDELSASGLEEDPDWLTMPAGFTDGARVRRDLPAVLGIGLRVAPAPWARILAGADIHFVDWSDEPGDGIPDSYRNGLDISLAAEADVLPSLTLSAGWCRSDPRGGGGHPFDLDHPLRTDFVGGGAVCRISPSFAVEAGLGRLESERENGGGPWFEDVSYEYDSWVLALGFTVDQR